jgi:hypothetical protein
MKNNSILSRTIRPTDFNFAISITEDGVERKNPDLDEEVCKYYVKRNCKHCHGRAVLNFSSNAYGISQKTWKSACYCVQNRLHRESRKLGINVSQFLKHGSNLTELFV